MSNITVEKLSKKTYNISITVEKEAVDAAFDQSLKHFAKNMTVEGFRRGKAPLNMVYEKVDKKKLNEAVINNLVPKYYAQALKEHLLKPITNPKIELGQFERGKDLVFKAQIVEKPDIALGDYKKALKEYAKGKGGDKKPTVDELINEVIKSSKIEIPDLLIENEATSMFSNLIDQTSRLGITVEDYLKSQNKTVAGLKSEYSKIAEGNLKADFILNEIAKKEKIEISDEDVKKAIEAAPDEKTREALSSEGQKWYIKSVLRKNRAIEHIINLVFGEKKEKENG